MTILSSPSDFILVNPMILSHFYHSAYIVHYHNPILCSLIAGASESWLFWKPCGIKGWFIFRWKSLGIFCVLTGIKRLCFHKPQPWGFIFPKVSIQSFKSHANTLPTTRSSFVSRFQLSCPSSIFSELARLFNCLLLVGASVLSIFHMIRLCCGGLSELCIGSELMLVWMHL